MTADEPEVENAKEHNFKLRKGAAAIDRAGKVFVPWGLYKVTGEWGFYRHTADPKTIQGENINFDKEWKQRDMFHKIPRNNLTGHNINETNFKPGLLEDWIDGALELNGTDQYCRLENGAGLDMGMNNFLIEAVIKGKSGPLVSKTEGGNGYSLIIRTDGRLRLSVYTGGVESYGESVAVINDEKWHHIIAQAARNKNESVDILIDGKPAETERKGSLKGDLSNKGVFLVGKKDEDEKNTGSYYRGMIDFLRVSQGTLADAETTIEELYKWEFDGPFLRDFYGNPARGKGRDSGAIEYTGEGEKK